jgi:hypothetical protein
VSGAPEYGEEVFGIERISVEREMTRNEKWIQPACIQAGYHARNKLSHSKPATIEFHTLRGTGRIYKFST